MKIWHALKKLTASCMLLKILCAASFSNAAEIIEMDNAMKNATPVRFVENPLITQGMSSEIGDNINGPSLIKIPDWVSNPLGKYYLYFAHHHGQHIRMAYADDLHGPWTLYSGGVLDLEETACISHIASPDVLLIPENQKIVMYFHGKVSCGKSMQRTFRASSDDGIHFTAESTNLGPFYFRVFRRNGAWFAIAKNSGSGQLLRSPDGIQAFTPGPTLLPVMRHAALLLENDHLTIFFSKIGDEPERILKTNLSLTGDWENWSVGEVTEVLHPEMDYEGGDLPLAPSKSGSISVPVNQLRDPAIFQENGRTYLFYSGAGENNICAAEFVKLTTVSAS